MDQFHPPVKDMIFALREVVGKGELDSNLGFEDFIANHSLVIPAIPNLLMISKT